MSKHIFDHSRSGADSTLLKSYTDVERRTGSAGPHEASKVLQRRPKERSSKHLQEFTRIERDSES